ncbi:MAG TPA: glycosyltransferase family 39 protein [Gaiellaceae bacterium]|nr:glycosyltransferase family 39 protein [Gaiellaceae bacterium]
MVASLRRIPAWVWLAAIVVASTVFRALLSRGIVAPFIVVDEIIWSELARGIASVGRPLVRGHSDPGYGVVYPLVISPAYALFHRLPEAYAAVKVVNSLVMSLAAIPAYLLARRVVGQGFALFAALLAVAIPSLAYTGTVMTENAFYPLFLVVALVLVLVLEEPAPIRVTFLVLLVALAFATRVQAVATVPAALLAPLVLAIFERRGLRSTLSRYRLLYGAFVVLGVLALLVQAVGGRSPQDLLGAYSPVGNASYHVGDVLRYVVWHAAELSLYVLVIPLAATIVLVGRARSLDARLQAFLAATVALTVCLIPVVATFASHFSDRIEERNTFYVAPLFSIALLAWVERGAPRPRVLAFAAAAVSAALVLLIPFDRFMTTSAITDTLMLLPFWSLQDRIGSGWISFAALVLAAGLAAAFLFVPRRHALVLPFVVLGLWAVALKPIWWGTHGFERFSRGSLFQGIRASHRDWIDRALPKGSDAKAAFLWTGRTDRLTVNQNEFFNRAIGPVYYVANPTPGGLPETRVRIDPLTGAVTLPNGAHVDDEYLVADSSFEPDGTRVAQDKGWGVTLWRVRPPLVSAVRIDGLYPNDTWSGRRVTWLRRRCVRGGLVVSMSSDPSLFLDPQTVVARSNGRMVGRVRFQPDSIGVMRVSVAPRPGTDRCTVTFTVSPTAIPLKVTGGGNPDRRVLGVHFNRFVYRPSP